MSAIRNYYESLGLRERRILISGSVAVVAILFYALVYQPVLDELNRLRIQVPKLTAQYLSMQQEAGQVRDLSGKQKSISVASGPLLTIIEKTAESAGVSRSIKRMQPAESNQVKVWLDDLHFDDWLNWINRLHSRGIVILTTVVTRARSNLVAVRVTFIREV